LFEHDEVSDLMSVLAVRQQREQVCH